MKKRCYPKYSYISFLLLSIVLAIFAFGPMIIQTDEAVVYKLLWSILMALLSVSMLMGALYYMQYYIIDDETIEVKSLFGSIEKLDLCNVRMCIESLPTYFSWVISINLEWICIYDNSNPRTFKSKFKSGCSNSIKKKRVQIIYDEETFTYLKKLVKTTDETGLFMMEHKSNSKTGKNR